MKAALFLGNAGHSSGGPEVYELELVKALARVCTAEEFHLMCLFPGAKRMLGQLPDNFVAHTLRPSMRAISMSVSLPVKLSRIRPQVVHSTFMSPPFVLQPHVMTLVCLSMFDRADLYPAAVRVRLQALTRMGLKRSEKVLCVSETLKHRAMELFSMDADRFVVVPLGVHAKFRTHSTQEVESYRLQEGFHAPYFLFSGRWERRKNLLGIIEAFGLFKRESGLPHKLVLSGKRTWIASEAQALIAKLGMQSEVIDHGKTPLEQLPALYAGATALVYASFYESFGFPILEAMACGTPVITSGITAMPETAGGAATLVDPESTDSIASAMYELAVRPDLRRVRREAGLQRVKAFTWENTARASLAVYRSVASVH